MKYLKGLRRHGNRDPDNEALLKLAELFDITVDTLLRGNEKAPIPEGERNVSEDDIKFALWGDVNDIDDDPEDVRRYAAYIRERKKNKRSCISEIHKLIT